MRNGCASRGRSQARRVPRPACRRRQYRRILAHRARVHARAALRRAGHRLRPEHVPRYPHRAAVLRRRGPAADADVLDGRRASAVHGGGDGIYSKLKIILCAGEGRCVPFEREVYEAQ